MALELPALTVRRSILAPTLGQTITDLIGIGIAVFLAAISAYWFFHKAWFPAKRKPLYLIGLLWVLLSAGVEAILFEQSNLFLLGLLALLFVPMAVAQRNGVID
jgi:hypothetical protein